MTDQERIKQLEQQLAFALMLLGASQALTTATQAQTERALTSAETLSAQLAEVRQANLLLARLVGAPERTIYEN